MVYFRRRNVFYWGILFCWGWYQWYEKSECFFLSHSLLLVIFYIDIFFCSGLCRQMVSNRFMAEMGHIGILPLILTWLTNCELDIVLWTAGIYIPKATRMRTAPFRDRRVWKRLKTPIARFMGPTWGPSGADRTQVGPMLVPWTLLSAYRVRYPCCRITGPCESCDLFTWPKDESSAMSSNTGLMA